MGTYVAVVRDLLDSLHGQGFRRFLLVNGHGGNSPAAGLAPEFMADRPDSQVVFHNWWNGPRTWAVVQSIDPDASHASWLENFPWTRLPGVESPAERKPMADARALRTASPERVRELLGDGSYGGPLRAAAGRLGGGVAGRRRGGARAPGERVAVTVAALEELVAIPSVSGDPARRDDVERAAAWLAARLGPLGGRVVPTGGHPLVLGRVARRRGRADRPRLRPLRRAAGG